MIQRVLAEDLKDTFCRLTDRGCDQQGMGRGVQLEVLVGVSQGVMRNQRGDVCQLGGFGLEKLAPRRGIEEQVAYRERSPRRRARIFARQQLTPGNFHPRAGAFRRRAGHHLHPCDGGDRGQRFAAKAQGRDREQVVAGAQLGGGVAFESQQGVVAHHAAAVVGDAYKLAPSALDCEDDTGGPGVESILQQLFDYRSRPVDDLAGGDLVGHLVGQYVDAAHRIATLG